MKRRWILSGVVLISALAFADDFHERILALAPSIGHYPASFKDKQDESAVKARYETLKKDLDAAIGAHPGSESLLAQRGALQAMGHNFDRKGAWEGATADLTAALKIDPNDVAAMLTLANLWVNSRPDLAKNAEALYRAAQCHEGDKPLEEAQRGLFFAFFYQGKVREAHQQAQFLHRIWPQVAVYTSYVDTAGAVLKRKGDAPPGPETRMASCADAAH